MKAVVFYVIISTAMFAFAGTAYDADSFLVAHPEILSNSDLYNQWKTDYASQSRGDAGLARAASPMEIRVNNGYVEAVIDNNTGEFDEGGDPSGTGAYVKLTFSYPPSFTYSSGTEWVMYYVDGNTAKTQEGLPIPDDCHSSGDTIICIWENWNGAYIRQELLPVSLGTSPGESEQIKFKAVIKSADTDTHNVGCIVYYDTKLNTNDGAPISTAFGYSGITQMFWADSTGGIPPIWHAYEWSFPPAPGDLVATGILTGYDASPNPPDIFWCGNWPSSVGNTWADGDWTALIGDAFSIYNDTATMVKWYPQHITASDSVIFVTYYGLGVVGTGVHIAHTPPDFAPDCGDVSPNPVDISATVTNGQTYDINDVSVILDLGGCDLIYSGGDPNPMTFSSIAGFGGSQIINWEFTVPPEAFGTTQCYNIIVISDEDTAIENYCVDIPDALPLVILDTIYFSEETDCDTENVLNICYNIGTCNDLPQPVSFTISVDSGETWYEPDMANIRNAENDLGEVITGLHCFDLVFNDELPDTELGNFGVRVSFGSDSESVVMLTTADDFSHGDTTHIKILSPDPDGVDDGALWFPPGSDTIYVLQVYPDGHCTDCVSSAIYTYMSDGLPPVDLKIYLMPISAFNTSATSPASVLSVQYIDDAGTIHSAEDRVFSTFDVIMFGVADSYGGNDLTVASADAVRAFCQMGKGLVLMHDTAGCSPGVCMYNFCSLTDISGISCGDTTASSWTLFTQVYRVTDETLPILNTPFDIPDTFNVLNCHWKGQVVEDGWILYRGIGTGSVPGDNLLYWQAFHNTEYNSFSSFYSYGHTESVPLEWEAKAMINSIYYSYHGGIGTGVYTSEPFDLYGNLGLSVLFDADIPTGSNMTIEVALDTCLGSAECWSSWYPADAVPAFAFDEFKYRVGMNLNSSDESPILHWIAFVAEQPEGSEITYFGPADSRHPDVTITCPPETVFYGDTFDVNFTIDDMFPVSASPESLIIYYCDGADTFIGTEIPENWGPDAVFCDSAYIQIAIADSFCNWSSERCDFSIISTGDVYLSFPETTALGCDTLDVALTIDSLWHPLASTYELHFAINSAVLQPISFTPSITPAPTTTTLTGSGNNWTLSMQWDSRVMLSGTELGTIRFLVLCDAMGGDYSPLMITSVESPYIESHWVNGAVLIEYNPQPWLEILRFDDIGEPHRRASLAFGNAPGANDLYDETFDLLYLPPPPSDVDVWFAMDDSLYPAITKLERDVRDMTPINEWKVIIDEDVPIYVHWNPNSFNEGIYFLNDIQDMRADSDYFAEPHETLTITWDLPEISLGNVSVNAGWNLVSLMIHSPSGNPLSIFPGATAGPFGYDAMSGAYFIPDRVEPGLGYWVYYSAPQEFPVAGVPVTQYGTNVLAGWNLVGATVDTLLTSDVGVVPTTSIFETFGYDPTTGNYFHADTLFPGKGYWMLINGEGVLWVPSH